MVAPIPTTNVASAVAASAGRATSARHANLKSDSMLGRSIAEDSYDFFFGGNFSTMSAITS